MKPDSNLIMRIPSAVAHRGGLLPRQTEAAPGSLSHTCPRPLRSSRAEKRSEMAEVQGADAPIFEGAIPVRVKHNDLDERQALLTLRISCEAQRPSSSHKVLRCRLTDEEDPFLLFTLDLNEEEFAPLKHEQRLLIDFTAFPTKLVELLEHCHEAASQHDPRCVPAPTTHRAAPGSPRFPARCSALSANAGHRLRRFIATLVSSAAGGVLSVVETNNFRQLYHISLQLRAGNDNEIKRYLAGRVKSFKVRAAA
jgi:spindle assembly abnormal protein 6